MAAIKYKVALTEAERSRLNEVSQRGKASVRTVKRALSLLKADQGLRDREIADVLLVNPATVARARKRYVEEGLEAAINDRPWPGQERKLDGRQEAHLIAFACSAAPEGHTHWQRASGRAAHCRRRRNRSIGGALGRIPSTGCGRMRLSRCCGMIRRAKRGTADAQYAGRSGLINIKRDDALLHYLTGHYRA